MSKSADEQMSKCKHEEIRSEFDEHECSKCGFSIISCYDELQAENAKLEASIIFLETRNLVLDVRMARALKHLKENEIDLAIKTLEMWHG